MQSAISITMVITTLFRAHLMAVKPASTVKVASKATMTLQEKFVSVWIIREKNFVSAFMMPGI